MQETLSVPQVSVSPPEGSPSFKVVIAYEDLEAGKHAKRTYDFLTQNLGTECEFSNQMWKFDVLGISKLREIAAKDAAVADVLMISSRGDLGLPTGVKVWIESWLAQGTRAIALVALFHPGFENSRTVRAYLADVARRGGLGFFAQPDQWPGNDNFIDEFTVRWQQTCNEKAPVPLRYAEPLVEPAPRWGLNE